MTTITNASLYDFTDYREQMYVRFDDTIRAVGPMRDYVSDGGLVIDARRCLVMPGLVLGHTHVYSAFARGLAVPFAPRSFRELLDQLWWKLDRNLDLKAVAASGAAAALDYLQNGVTAIVDHHASGAVKGSLAALAGAMTGKGGIRAAFCFETSDRFDTSACIGENLAFSKTTRPGASAALFGLHASLTLAEATLSDVAAKRDGLPVHVHAAESEEDETDCLAKYGERVIARFDRHGLVTPGSLYAHCVHCDDHELAILAERGATVAVNPTSNMNNGVGLPDVGKMLALGIPVILGDDGLSASAAAEIRNLYFAMHHRYGSPTAFGASDLKKIIASTYAFASGLLGVTLGRIAAGCAADLLVLAYDPATPIDAGNAFDHFLFGMTHAFKPRDVFVAGEAAVMDHVPSARLVARAAKAKAAARDTWKRIASEDEKT